MSFHSKARVCFEFEIEKITGVSDDGRYQVQWAPAWVNRFQLVGCEHLIEQFLQQQVENEIKSEPDISLLEQDHCWNSLEVTEGESDGQTSVQLLEAKEENSSMHFGTFTSIQQLPISADHALSFPIDKSLSATVVEKCLTDQEFSESDSNSGSTHHCDHHQKQPQISYKQLVENASIHQVDTEIIPKCNICASEFSDMTELQVHLQTHSNETSPQGDKQLYTCDQCGYSCQWSGHLTNHMRKHTGEKPYMCETCGKSFSQKSHLTDHNRIHTGERPYACTFCDSKFARTSVLKQHLRRHTGEKPFQCQVCGKSFTVKKSLLAHMHSSHPPLF